MLNMLTALAIHQSGRISMMSVVDLEIWKPPLPVTGATFPAGGHVAMEKQTADVLTALAVDGSGRLVVTSVAGVGEWKAPVAISDAIFTPGAPVVMASQTDGVLTALAINTRGKLVVTSVGGLGKWKPPVEITDAIFTPGAPLAMAKQTPGVLTALAVNRFGKLVVTSVGGLGNWQPPVELTAAIFTPGTHVAMAKQTEGVLTALAVNKFGKLVVTSVAGLGNWQPPVELTEAIFTPGAPVAMAKQTEGVLTALAINKFGKLVVTSVAGLGNWEAPVELTGAIFTPGAPVAMAKQTDGVLAALAVNSVGLLVVTSVSGLGTWQAPVGLTEPVFLPGTPVAMARQIENQDPCKYKSRISGSTMTKRVAQITGDSDPEGLPHMNFSSHWGAEGADLGANTVFEGRLFIFFGDVPRKDGVPSRPRDADLVAHSSSTNPEALLLEPVLDPDGGFHPFSIEGRGPLFSDQTPTGAFSYGDRAYVFIFMFEKGAPVSLLTASKDPRQPRDFEEVFELSRDKFFQAAPQVIRNNEHPGLPSVRGDGLILLGHGGDPARVSLAWTPLAPGRRPDKAGIRYYKGSTPEDQNPWSPDEGKAKPLFRTVVDYTALSVAWLPEAKRWLLLYSQAEPKRNPNGPIVARLGATPWDWSEEIILFDPLRDNAWGTVMHRPPCDQLHTLAPRLPPVAGWAYDGRPGWAYGAFLLTGFTSWNAEHRLATIYYLLSTSTPYQVHVMRSQLRVP